MTTKELIKAEIDSVPEERLDDLYELIKSFVQSGTKPNKPTLMDSLLEIQIDGPEVFPANLDLYLSGEKREEPNVR